MANIDIFDALHSFDYDTVKRDIREGQEVKKYIREGYRILLSAMVREPQNERERIGRNKIIQLLVENGAKLEQKHYIRLLPDNTLSSCTYLMHSARLNDRNLTKLLLDLGAKPDQIAVGCTVLEYVLSTNYYYYDLDTAELLLMYGADPQKVKFGKSTGRYNIETFANLPVHLQNLIERYNELIETGAMDEINNLTTTGPDSPKTFIHRAIQRAMALDNEQRFVDLTPEVDQPTIKNIFKEAKLLQRWTHQTNKHFLPSFRRRVFTSMLQAQRQTKDYTQLPPELYHKLLSISSEKKDVDVSTLPSFISRPAIVF